MIMQRDGRDMTPQEIAEWEAQWVNPPSLLSLAPGIKAECRRRILLIMTEDQQRNALAAGQAAVMQYGADPANWPPQLQQRQSAIMGAWAEIERLRSRSDKIEAMEPIPTDYTDDDLW